MQLCKFSLWWQRTYIYSICNTKETILATAYFGTAFTPEQNRALRKIGRETNGLFLKYDPYSCYKWLFSPEMNMRHSLHTFTCWLVLLRPHDRPIDHKMCGRFNASIYAGVKTTTYSLNKNHIPKDADFLFIFYLKINNFVFQRSKKPFFN